MSRFIETIKISDGVVERLDLHQERMDRTRREVLHLNDAIPLRIILKDSGSHHHGTWKCRLLYSAHVHEISITPYQYREIGSLRLVDAGQLSYSYKYEDRSQLEECKGLRESCDEVILVKNGLLTDTTYTNLAFYDGHQWLTPAQPLLAGTMRNWLLARGTIHERILRPTDLVNFEKVSLINAMLELDELSLPVSSIRW